ncbi:hypothetical protein CesoFtcFv8_010791 [Champsocephalus esox]|uniref:Uncharacterized protein n=1 Tax=Champsocephalus esox TaxID=159716 RepID=A0AAN8C150_9TELE|nr:hypothetical protein CesoFtcFv8_010791 [Champsocephalus esox]
MRIFWKNVLAVLLLVGGLYYMSQSNLLIAGQPQKVITSELTWSVQRLVSKESWVEQGDYLPLNVSYQLLAGAPSTQQRFLSVGLSSVKRAKGSYLIPHPAVPLLPVFS